MSNNTTKVYHVQLTPKAPGPSGKIRESAFDLALEELEKRFLTPYRDGNPIVINGRTIAMDGLDRIRVFESERTVGNLAQIPWQNMPDVTNEFIIGPPGSAPEATPRVDQELRPDKDAREVFVVHGRNLVARNALFEFLRAIDLHPLEWSEVVTATAKPLPYIGEILDAAFSKAHAVVVLFTPDDEARLRQELRSDSEAPHETELTGQARPNVLFEAGMAMGRYAERTVLVELGSLRPFSDIAGLYVIRMDGSSQRRQELAQRLRVAGCPVKLDGTAWHSAGDFHSVLTEIQGASSNSQGHAQAPLSDVHRHAMSQDASQLLREVVEDAEKGTGAILKFKTLGGTFIKTNGKNFGEAGNRRSIARWESAIVELVDLNYLEDPTGKDSFFQPTHKGFEAAENLGST